MKKLALTLVSAAFVLGPTAIAANAQSQSRRRRGFPRPDQERHPDRTGGLPGLWPLLPAGLHPGLRPLSLLVPALPLSGLA